MGNEEIKLSQFADYMIVCMGSTQKSSRINNFIQQDCRIQDQHTKVNPIQINDECLGTKCFKTIQFIIILTK
jgi:hypothetical protein